MNYVCPQSASDVSSSGNQGLRESKEWYKINSSQNYQTRANRHLHDQVSVGAEVATYNRVNFMKNESFLFGTKMINIM